MRSGMFRILIVERDRVFAFRLQCELRRLSVPFSMLHVGSDEGLEGQVAQFRPDVLIAVADGGMIPRLKVFSERHPALAIVAICKNTKDQAKLSRDTAVHARFWSVVGLQQVLRSVEEALGIRPRSAFGRADLAVSRGALVGRMLGFITGAGRES